MSAQVTDKSALLTAVLKLEVKNGYSDRAVIGGLDNFIRKWAESEARGASRLKAVLFDGTAYSAKSIEERQAWVARVLEEVERPSRPGPATVPKAAKSTTQKAKPAPAPAARKPGMLDSPATSVKGVGEAVAKRLAKLNVLTVRDMVYHFPRRFIDFSRRCSISELAMGQEQTVFVNVWEARTTMLGRMRSTEAVLGDETGNIRAVWFNQPWVAKQLKTNSRIALSGRVTEFNFSKVFENPEWELINEKELLHTGRLVPVYQLTQGLYPRQVRAWIKSALDCCVKDIDDYLPPSIRTGCNLIDLQRALMQAHYPADYAAQGQARQRLAFDELFLLQLGVLSRKKEWQEDQPGRAFRIEAGLMDKFIGSLPFKLTGAQDRVMGDICADLAWEVPMSRLVQGDVGSGKTVVATLALLMAVHNGYQGAFMAPTEILSEQHFNTLVRLLSEMGRAQQLEPYLYSFGGIFPSEVKVALLTGSMSAKEKSAVHAMIKAGEVNLIIGTHALIQKGVEFKGLGMVVIDEQHRFGVMQRTALRQKGFNPHLLVMTATPIPRTLALTLWGDLDISTIDEMPPGRQVIKTRWLKPDERNKAYNFIRRQVGEGRQAFIICPLIEESENLEAKAAIAEHERLQREVFPELRLGLLHGRMKGADKEAVMHEFKEGRLDILVSTAVIEVGIDIPNATVMLIEAADRFGLSQLHQFRGRVGRGEQQSYCMLLAENPSDQALERLRIIETVNDGFILAEKDLELRGPGEFFGTRQSGMPDLKMARLSDTHLLELARKEARKLFAADPALSSRQNALLVEQFHRMWDKSVENN